MNRRALLKTISLFPFIPFIFGLKFSLEKEWQPTITPWKWSPARKKKWEEQELYLRMARREWDSSHPYIRPKRIFISLEAAETLGVDPSLMVGRNVTFESIQLSVDKSLVGYAVRIV